MQDSRNRSVAATPKIVPDALVVKTVYDILLDPTKDKGGPMKAVVVIGCHHSAKRLSGVSWLRNLREIALAPRVPERNEGQDFTLVLRAAIVDRTIQPSENRGRQKRNDPGINVGCRRGRSGGLNRGVCNILRCFSTASRRWDCAAFYAST